MDRTQRGRSQYSREIARERFIGDFVPYSNHITPTTIVTKDGDFMRIWRVGGISFETIDPEDTGLRKEQLNTLLRSIGNEHVSIWTHNIRRQVSDRLESTFDNDFCRNLDRKYYDSFTGYKMMANELYLTVIYRPHPSRIARAANRMGKKSVAEMRELYKIHTRSLDEIAYQIEASMKRYDLEVLSSYEEDGVLYSNALSFLNFLLTGEWQSKIRLPSIPLYEYLGNAWVFCGSETIELRGMQQCFMQGLDFRDYVPRTQPGILNALMYEDCEYILTQSFCFMPRRDGKSFLERQQRQLSNTDDGSITQIKEMSEAIDHLTQGAFSMGQYHFTLMVLGGSVEQVTKKRSSMQAILHDQGFVTAVISTALDAAFLAQLPGNWLYRPRIAGLTSLNFASLSGFHNFSSGKRDGNPWGQAVTLLKTSSGQPYYLNYHASKDDEDVFDKKLLGNTRIIGQSGAGKTVLLGMMLCQNQKFKADAPNGYSEVFFDKDQGAKIAILAIGGRYFTLRTGESTGFNPFQMEPTEENILFLEQLVRKLVSGEGQRFTTSDEMRVSHAVRTVMRMPAHLRRLSTVTQNMTEGTDKEDRENSIVKRLSKWCQGGSLGWVLDNPVDKLDFTTHSTYGFDGTAFLDNNVVRTPISMYLLHRMESIIDGRRFVYYMDEFWKWLLDDTFSEFALNKQKTIRKQNGLGIFATQSPSDVLGSPIAKAIIEQCATEIYLPNPKADRKEYIEGFKVTEAEFQIIRDFGEDSRMFLVKQGHQSAIAHLNLYPGFDDELAVLSGSSDNVELVDKIIAEVGDDPAIWLPLFHERRKERAAQSKRRIKS